MTVQAHVDPEIRRTWPAYEAAVVIAQDNEDNASDAQRGCKRSHRRNRLAQAEGAGRRTDANAVG